MPASSQIRPFLARTAEFNLNLIDLQGQSFIIGPNIGSLF
uniref:Uncharacterized protein n=1 Tax=uncultured bacterium A1Q1_fos_2111 TaxID=1256563 RepID=L7VYY1_9BACT|nr:hypothetical protein [uncultured bacterium A1Q1_fos_2111]